MSKEGIKGATRKGVGAVKETVGYDKLHGERGQSHFSRHP
jgi:hypothetical protein